MEGVLESFHDQVSVDTASGNGAEHDLIDTTRVDDLNPPIYDIDEHEFALPASGQLRFGVVGYGYWGPQLARNLARVPMGRVTHIADRAPERRWEAHREHPSTCVTTSIDEVLASDVDALAIATPIRTHYPLARAALEHGKHVLVEKPLADSVAHAEDLAALARERGLVLMVGHTYMYSPAVEELRRLVQSGALGRVYYVDSIRANLGIVQKDINVIWDLAPHDISILGYIFGAAPLRVSAHGGAYVQRQVTDVAQLTLHYPNGMLAFIHVSWLSPSKIRRFTIAGDRQMVVYDDVETLDKIRVYNRGIEVPDHTSTFGEFQLSYRYGDIVSPFLHWSEPLGTECERFAEAILKRGAPRSDANDGLRVVRVLEAADRSMAAEGAFIDIPQPAFWEDQTMAPLGALRPVPSHPMRAKAGS
jgi:predicted dehydrogenase